MKKDCEHYYKELTQRWLENDRILEICLDCKKILKTGFRFKKDSYKSLLPMNEEVTIWDEKINADIVNKYLAIRNYWK